MAVVIEQGHAAALDLEELRQLVERQQQQLVECRGGLDRLGDAQERVGTNLGEGCVSVSYVHLVIVPLRWVRGVC